LAGAKYWFWKLFRGVPTLLPYPYQGEAQFVGLWLLSYLPLWLLSSHHIRSIATIISIIELHLLWCYRAVRVYNMNMCFFTEILDKSVSQVEYETNHTDFIPLLTGHVWMTPSNEHLPTQNPTKFGWSGGCMSGTNSWAAGTTGMSPPID
jgi:hypothetical protein